MGFLTASRLNKMKNSFREGDYEKAVMYADKLNPSEIRTTYDLSMMSDVYMQTNRLAASKRVLAEMYKRNKSIRVCKQLVELNIKLKNVKQAIRYVKEIHQFDPEDYDRFIYQYQIGKMLNQSDEYLIACLDKVKESDYIDKWALELAKLYYKAGYMAECEKECQNIKLWFPDTEYANKADMLLRACKAGVGFEQSVGTKLEPVQSAEEYFEEEYENDENGEEYFDEDYSEEEFVEEEYSEEFVEEEAVTEYIEETEDDSEEKVEEENQEEEFTLELSDELFEDEDETDPDELIEFDFEEDAGSPSEEVAVALEESEEAEYSDEEYFGEGGYEFEEDEEPELTEDGFEAIDFSSINFEELRRKNDIDRIIAEEEQKEDKFDLEDAIEESTEPDDAFEEFGARLDGRVPAMTEISADEEVFFDISDSVKEIMDNDETNKQEEDFATTLVNDSLTNEVMSALLEQENHGFESEDAVDESIRKMLEE